MKNFWFILCFGILLIFSLKVLALTISPAKIALSANPGETIEFRMSVRNDLDKSATFYSTIENLTVKGGEEPVFLPADFGLPTWIEVQKEITLGPKERVEIPVLIRVPKDAPPGGHYAAIFWQTAPPDRKEPGIGIVTKVGALILLEVSGEVVEKAEVLSFGAEKKFFTHLPVNFSFDLKNEGNVHIIPEGRVYIKNLFGKTVTSLNVNPGGFYALPQTTRRFFTQSFEPKGGMPKIEGKGFFTELKREISGFALGYYRANLNLEYGKGKKVIEANFGFWVLPIRVLSLSLLILAIILLILTKGISAYNRWIINRAKKLESKNE
jgi:hypothetical protein